MTMIVGIIVTFVYTKMPKWHESKSDADFNEITCGGVFEVTKQEYDGKKGQFFRKNLFGSQ